MCPNPFVNDVYISEKFWFLKDAFNSSTYHKKELKQVHWKSDIKTSATL